MRGTEYGAIDTGSAFLDGLLLVDFTSLTPLTSLMTFDLITATTGSILGDFSSLHFDGLWSGYTAYGGIENDRYRLYVAPVGVPKPPTAALLVATLALLSLQRRRAACRAAR